MEVIEGRADSGSCNVFVLGLSRSWSLGLRGFGCGCRCRRKLQVDGSCATGEQRVDRAAKAKERDGGRSIVVVRWLKRVGDENREHARITEERRR